jgi:hypothetical protein
MMALPFEPGPGYGEVTWQGEESADIGKIIVTNNQVSTKAGTVLWE